MKPSTPEHLEQQLRELTTWTGEPTRLWEGALDEVGSPSASPAVRDARSILTRRLGGPWLLGVAACAASIIMIGVLVPSLGRARSSAPGSLSRLSGPLREAESQARVAASPDASVAARLEWEKGTTPSDQAARHVVQKATIELHTPDVRAVFAKANHLVSVASGEYVENSSLTGDGQAAQANLTLRVAVARLSEVLGQLRELGEVKSENTTGEDVTSQVVDLEARIRNEQRIEKEILELLDKRGDAPLKDILELRASLASVRQTIEQQIAQRDRLGRLVSLASILVVIRAEPESEAPKPAESIGTYFWKSVSDAWRTGLHAASDSVSWLVGIAVSGALWWLLLGSVAFAIIRYRRRLAARCV